MIDGHSLREADPSHCHHLHANKTELGTFTFCCLCGGVELGDYRDWTDEEYRAKTGATA